MPIWLLAVVNCASGRPRYQLQRAVPGSDGVVYVQAIKSTRALGVLNRSKPVILNCRLRGAELRCDKELKITYDSQYWQEPGYFQKEVSP